MMLWAMVGIASVSLPQTEYRRLSSISMKPPTLGLHASPATGQARF